MKIVYIVARYPHLYHTFIWREIREVIRQGIDIEVYPVANHSPTADERAQLAGEPFASHVVSVPLAGTAGLAAVVRLFARRPVTAFRLLAMIVRGTWRQPLNLLKSLAVFPMSCVIAERIRAGGFRHIHAHWSTHPATCAFIASRLADVPFSFAFHAYDIYDTRIMLADKLRAAAFAVANCRYTIEFMERTMTGFDRSKVRLLYNGIELERYRDLQRHDEPRPLLLAVGRLVPTKGFEDLIDAVRRLRDEGRIFRVEIVGAGPFHDRLQARIDAGRLHDAVELIGPRSEAGVRDLLGRAALTIVPACPPARGNSHDGLPNIVIESLAAGVPVIATSLYGIPEVVRDGVNGLLVQPNDPGALAAAIVRLLDDGGLARRIADEGRRTADFLFDTRRNVATLIGYFHETIGP